MKILFLIPVLAVVLTGCATLKEFSKQVAGTSTRSLENGKADSIFQEYPCTSEQCFNAVLDLAQKNKYYVFIKDQVRGLIVLMNIPGCVDTTEVGVFFTELSKDRGVKIELSSRSAPAKKIVAKVLFDDLAVQFKE